MIKNFEGLTCNVDAAVVAMETAGAISYQSNNTYADTEGGTRSHGCAALLQREINQQSTTNHLTNHLIFRGVRILILKVRRASIHSRADLL